MAFYDRFLSFENFRIAWEDVAENRGCAGVDGETIEHFTLKADQYLAVLQKAVAQGTYHPLPLRQILIPKKSGGVRELGVPTVRDRIVQQALLNVLHPLLEPQFEPCSFAYRPGRSHLLAVERVGYWRDRGHTWVLDADIVNYFGEISHDRLLAEVRERLDEPKFLTLIRSWITAPVLTGAGLVMRQKGIPQGAVVSPILANVYLDDLDERLTELGLKVVRFADDFLVMARTEQRIIEAKQEVADLLSAMKLKLHPEKTQVTNFDRGFRFLGHAFAKTVVVQIKKPTQDQNPTRAKDDGLRLIHADPMIRPTQMQLAMVEALRVAQTPIPPPLFVVLGYQVRTHDSGSIASDETTWKIDMATLYLVQQGTVMSREQECFVVQPPKEPKLEIPIRECDRVLVFGNVQLTTAVISTCLELKIPVVFLTQLGEYKGHLWSAESANLTLETAQFERQKDQAFRLAIAKSIVQGKLWNSKQGLLRLNRKRQFSEVVDAIARLDELREAVGRLDDAALIDQVRGYEGAGAAQYFSAMSKLIVNPGFTFTERNFHPPKDPMNALLSFGYTLLLNNVFSLLLAEGLNPYLGNLHGMERQRADLAFDLMEEFRSPIVDTLVMKLVNQKILSPTDFTYPKVGGGIYLENAARRTFLKHFEARICETVSHPDVQTSVSYRRVIQLQVKRYVKALLGNCAYEPFRRVI
ncbi:CRISPR-associated endonuclease Cas1 [Phormidesmis sp. 146-35]